MNASDHAETIRRTLPFAPAKVEPRVATWCECGEAIVGLAGILYCEHCGRLWSVSRMEFPSASRVPLAVQEEQQ